MSNLLNSLQTQLTGRAVLGLVCLLVIGAIWGFDHLSRLTAERELSLLSLKEQIVELEALKSEDDIDGLTEQATADLATYKKRLMSEATEGLNSAKLQSTVIQTLNQCGLQQVRADLQTSPHEDFSNRLVYAITIRARDTETVFPLCLAALENSTISAKVSSLQWNRNGIVTITLEAYGSLINAS